MDSARPQPSAERPQQELLFDLDGGPLLEKLADFTKKAQQDLALTAVNAIRINVHDKYDLDEYVQFRNGIRGLSANGTHRFELESDARLLYEDESLRPTALGLFVQLATWNEMSTILHRPLYGSLHSHDPMVYVKANSELRAAEVAGSLPVKLPIRESDGNPNELLEDVQKILHNAKTLKMGIRVSNMRLAPYRHSETLENA